MDEHDPMDERYQVQQWVEQYFCGPSDRKILINALLAMQERFGYLPKSGIRQIAQRMGRTPADAFGVATFYNHFRFVPPGRHAIKVCMGTACHIKQASKVLEHFERSLGIGPGGVTADREYSLDRVACVGCCTLAPVALDNDRVIAEMSPTKIDGLMLQHRLARESNDEQEPGA
jgi:NADH-quinone oxidoreductase subunit E